MGKQKYFPNNKIGPYNIFYKEKISPSKGIFICPLCNKDFIASISSVGRGKTKCCKECYKKNFLYSDIAGQKFGKLTAISPTEDKKGTSIVWKCQCDCGKITYASVSALKYGAIKSCGCYNIKDYTGQKIGHLTVLESTDYRKNRCVMWKCRCDCGKIHYVRSGDLNNKSVTSCGNCCISRGEDKIKEILQSLNIKFVQQKTFEDCINPKSGHKLRFDFYLPDYNICIEYDGEQHFRYTDGKGWITKEKFKYTKELDSIKNLYCKEKSIKLFRFSYKEFEKIDKTYLKDKIGI